MTDPMVTLLHDEASALDIPAPPTEAVLARGHTMRRRRRAGVAAAALAALAVVGSGSAVAVNAVHHKGRAVEPAGPSTGHGAVFSVGSTVFYDGGTHHIAIDDKAIKS